ncbi:MAG: preprotein translocase subunit SecE [Acholeplasmataceae bacterium]|jgi:preprotein translocase subunit SecE
MAVKKRDEQLKSKLMEVLTTEYKWENLLLGFLAVASAALSMMIINKTLQIDASFPILGTGNNGIIFAWFLFAISMVGLLLVLFPFFQAAFPEVRKIAWPTRKKFVENSAKTLIYLVVLTLVLFLFDFLIIQTLGRLIGN